jgi:phage anti-repressor protein
MELSLKIIKKNKIECISARELYEKLEIKSRFNDWFNRMREFGFVENEDYKAITQKKVTAQGNESEYTDYAISVDMAKQICMLQRNEKGMQYRRYLLDVERRFKEKQAAEYKQIRDKSKAVRNLFAESLNNHGIKENYEYINITRNMKKPFGITAKKKDMTKSELTKITASEFLAEAMLGDEYGYSEVNPVCVEACNVVKNALQKRIAG